MDPLNPDVSFSERQLLGRVATIVRVPFQAVLVASALKHVGGFPVGTE
jgi:hypothetical protein